jgi:hypothetical protein
VTRIAGAAPSASIAGSPKAATPAGLGVVTTTRSIVPGCSIVQTVTPPNDTPNSHGTTRQRGDGSRPSGNSNSSAARAGTFNSQVQYATQASQAAAGSDPGAVT